MLWHRDAVRLVLSVVLLSSEVRLPALIRGLSHPGSFSSGVSHYRFGGAAD